MAQKKLKRFGEIKTFSNVFEYPENMQGKWKDFFKNNNPIVLELACGKGEYSTNLGREYKNRNFIGIDIKGNRIYVGAKTALKEDLGNVSFLRIQIGQLTEYFAKDEVSEIWIIFPDPFLRKSKAKNRLTHPRFLRLYQQILKDGAPVRLKTDSKELYDFTLETIAEQGCTIVEQIEDVYGKGKAEGALAIQTFYEKMHLAEGRTIYYIAFSLPKKAIELPLRKKNEEGI